MSNAEGLELPVLNHPHGAKIGIGPLASMAPLGLALSPTYHDRCCGSRLCDHVDLYLDDPREASRTNLFVLFLRSSALANL